MSDLTKANQVEYDLIDRSDWPNGEWDQEADKYVWVDLDTDLDCMIVRNQFGSLCGYVGVPPTHPWHGLAYNQCPEQCPTSEQKYYCEHEPDDVVEVHGGLTYSNGCVGHICHIPAEGREDDVWWFGFDCGHAFDLIPGMISTLHGIGISPLGDERYRNVSYVKQQVSHLARQLKDLS